MDSAELVPHPDDPDKSDLILSATREVVFDGLTRMDCVVYGIGILRQHLLEAMDEVEKVIGEDGALPVAMFRDLLDTLEVTSGGDTG